MLEKTLESPLDNKEIKRVNPKGNQPSVFIRRTHAEASILWPPDTQSRLFGKDPDSGKDWGQEKKGRQGMRWMDGIIDSVDMSLTNFERWWKIEEPGMPCPWGQKESDMSERLNNHNRNAEPWSLSWTECLRICLLTWVYASDEHWADFLYLLGTNTATFWVSIILSKIYVYSVCICYCSLQSL